MRSIALWELLVSTGRITFLMVIIAALALLGFTFYIYLARRRYAHLPTPPFKSFYLAHGAELAEGDKTGTVDQIFIRWAQQCGPVYYFTILSKVIVTFNTPELAKEILTNSKYGKAKNNYKRAHYLCGIRFMAKGLATNIDHEDWKMKRAAIGPAFHKSTLKRLTMVFNDAADRLISELETVADTGNMVSMLEQLHRTTLDVIGQAAFSEDILDTKNGNFIHSIYIALKMLTLNFRNPFFAYLPWNKAFIHEVKQNVLYLRSRAIQMVEKRIKLINDGQKTPEDILDVMIRNLADKCPLEDIADEVITMFIAGQETTANLMSFLLLELGRNPEMMQNIRNEVDSIVGSKRFISQEDVANLDWVTVALKETLRLHPPAAGTARDFTDKDETLEGFNIPGKSLIFMNFFAIQILTVKDGFLFRPERFFSEKDFEKCGIVDSKIYDPELVPRMYSQLGFSLGQRSCIGRNFALLESKILTTKLFQHFSFKLNPNESFRVENAGTYKPADGAKMFVFKRS